MRFLFLSFISEALIASGRRLASHFTWFFASLWKMMETFLRHDIIMGHLGTFLLLTSRTFWFTEWPNKFWPKIICFQITNIDRKSKNTQFISVCILEIAFFMQSSLCSDSLNKLLKIALKRQIIFGRQEKIVYFCFLCQYSNFSKINRAELNFTYKAKKPKLNK